MAISKFGWRSTYGIVGAIASIIGVLTIALVKEPARKIKDAMDKNKKANDLKADEIDFGYTDEEKEEMKEKPFKYFWNNPACRWTIAASFLRNVGGSVTTYFLPVFYLKNFGAYKA